MLAIVALSLGFISADRFSQTTANPDTKMLQIRLKDQWFEINLDTPGIKISRYPNGTLKQISIQIVNISYSIHFYEQIQKAPEKVALIKRFQSFQDRLLLHGKTERYDEDGHLLVEINWQEGKLHGAQRIYNRDFKLIEEREYDSGFPIGLWKTYYPDGNIASEISFPASSAQWRDTRLEGKAPSSGHIAVMNYHHPVKAKETWYYLNGSKQREREFDISEYQLSYTIMPTGASTSFSPHGTVVRNVTVALGEKHEHNTLKASGNIYYKDKLWYSDSLFKEWEQLHIQP
ncbi:MAG: toxin-antitoxin system YwqK family antitoxin [Chlamydiales bacterium]|nr:toxin-antitoxin system YwqK family antitoxin [Chlamydiales bacterium]